MMLVLDATAGVVTYASANAGAFLGQAQPEADDCLIDIVGATLAHDLRNAAAKGGGTEVAGVLLRVALPEREGLIDATIHTFKDRVFIELEPSLDGGESANNALDLTQSLVRRIGLQSSVAGIAKEGAKLIRAMLNYDRVMVYQFLHNGAGQVIAEAKRSSLGSFMGQRFPASDIPFQARRLYLLNSIRMIGDVQFTPTPLTPALAAGEQPVDMSFAHLRSVSPIHCLYLQNMGVRASLSISIIVDGQLWGLISCHHDTPKVVPMPLRIGAELFGQYFSLQIAAAERRAAHLAAAAAREKLDKIITALDPSSPVGEVLHAQLPALADLMECDGAGLWLDGHWTSFGASPTSEAAPALMACVTKTAEGAVWSTQAIAETWDNLDGYGGRIAGLIAVPLSSVSRDYLLLFRSEEAHEVEWAGEPVKQVIATPSGDRLTPRGSFDIWREDVRGQSKPWTIDELAVADAIRTYLRDIVLRYTEKSAEERQKIEKRRRVLNDELNHRVKNIISLVKSIAIQTGAHASSVEDYSESLEGRLRALAFAHDQSLTGASTGDLSTLIEAEASLYRYGAAPDRVTANGPRIGLDDRTFGVLALVIHELMTNAAKYGALSVGQGRLSVAWKIDDTGACEIDWIETEGPAVVAPTRIGFGSKLIESTISYDLGGAAQLEFAPTGLHARLMIPAHHLREPTEARASTASNHKAASSLIDLDVLVVEDHALIAMDTEDILQKLGARSVRTCPNVAEAKGAILSLVPDCAVLDFNLGDETSAVVADELAARRVPFVFSTGYGDSVMIPERFRGVPVVRKPINASILAESLDDARDFIAASFDPPHIDPAQVGG